MYWSVFSPLRLFANLSCLSLSLFFLCAVSCYSLFPLLFEAQEYPIKVLLLLLHSILMWFGFSEYFSSKPRVKGNSPLQKNGNRPLSEAKSASANGEGRFFISVYEQRYLIGLLVVEIWGQFLHPFFLGDKLPFIPLMLTSIHCALGITYSWFWQLKAIIRAKQKG